MREHRLVYDEYISLFEDLLSKDSTVSIHHCNVQKMYKIKYNVGPQLIDDLFCKKALNTRSKASFFIDTMLEQLPMENSLGYLAQLCGTTWYPKV